MNERTYGENLGADPLPEGEAEQQTIGPCRSPNSSRNTHSFARSSSTVCCGAARP